MAYTAREFPMSSEEVFAVLVDPQTYPSWLIGASEIRDVDDTWPAVGSKFHHRVGIGPLALPDDSKLLAIDAPHLLRLRVRVRPLITAVVTFRLIGDTSRCVVTIAEEPTIRLIGNVVRPVMDPIIHIRNHRSLRRLERYLAGKPTR